MNHHRSTSHYLNVEYSNHFLDDFDPEVHISLPRPINEALLNSPVDFIEKCHDNCRRYSRDFDAISNDLKKMNLIDQNFTKSHVTITQGLLDLCNEDGHHSNFICDYNPYYATNLMGHISLNGQDYLIRPDVNNVLRYSNLSKLSSRGKRRLKLDVEQPIFGIWTNSENVLLLRHKNAVSLIELGHIKEEVSSQFVKKFKFRLFDAKFQTANRWLGALFDTCQLALYDVATNKRIRANVDKATRFDFMSEDKCVGVLGVDSLKIYDLRSTDNYKMFTPKVSDCNQLISFKVDGNVVYLATRHYLMRTDIRTFNNTEYCSHLMKQSPCFIDNIDNIVSLASQASSDNVVVFAGSSLPRSVPQIKDTLAKCGMGYGVHRKLDGRFEKSFAGIKMLRHHQGCYLYTMNCLGDVFSQRISLGGVSVNDEDDPKAVEALQHWIDKIPHVPKPLYITNLVNLQNARLILNQRCLTENLGKFINRRKKLDLFLETHCRINNFGDLGGNFASIWDDEDDKREDDVDIVPEVQSHEKVSRWISSSYFED